MRQRDVTYMFIGLVVLFLLLLFNFYVYEIPGSFNISINMLVVIFSIYFTERSPFDVKGNPIGLANLVFIILSVIFLLSMFNQFLDNFGKEFAELFQPICTAVISEFIILIYFYIKGGLKRYWFWITFHIIIVFLVMGTMTLNYGLGQQKLDLKLNEGERSTGVLHCKDTGGKLLVGNEVKCMGINLTNQTGYVELLFNNESSVKYLFNDTVSFISLYGIRRININIIGLDKDANHKNISTGADFKFLTIDEYQNRKDKLLAYFLALFGIAFFSIPSMMRELKDLYGYN